MTKLPKIAIYLLSIAMVMATCGLVRFVLDAKPLGISWDFGVWIGIPAIVWLGFVVSYVHNEYEHPDLHTFAATLLTTVAYIAFVSLIGSFVYLGSM